MLTVLSIGDGKYRLEDLTGMPVSWINDRVIGFRGFPTERSARDAAVAGWRALGVTLRHEIAGWIEYAPSIERLRTVHDGAYEWFYDGTTAIARLLRPQRRAHDATFGIQFVLPTYAMDGTLISAAQNVAVAVAPFRELLADSIAAPRDDSTTAPQHGQFAAER